MEVSKTKIVELVKRYRIPITAGAVTVIATAAPAMADDTANATESITMGTTLLTLGMGVMNSYPLNVFVGLIFVACVTSLAFALISRARRVVH